MVAFSSGNHAQAIALAARLLGMPATIVMPHDAPAAKLAATRGYGGEVVLYDRYTEDREEIGRRLAEERGMTLIPPYDHPDVIAGQGTAAKELFEEVGAARCAVRLPRRRRPARRLGAGGARAVRRRARSTASSPKPATTASSRSAAAPSCTSTRRKTIADGAQTQHLGELTFAIIRRDVDDILTATDAELVEAMRFFAERMKMVVEPTGCLGFAAARRMKRRAAGQRVGVIVSGGNVDLARFCRAARRAAALRRRQPITFSACRSSTCGTASRSSVAVRRLIVRLTRVGCSIGRSPGRAPFRILSTSVDASRTPSAGSTP